MVNANHIKGNVTRLRKGNNLKQVTIDKYLGLANGTYSTYENGTKPKLETLLELIEMYKPYVKIPLSVEIIYKTDLSLIKDEDLFQIEKTSSTNREVPNNSDQQKTIEKDAFENKSVKVDLHERVSSKNFLDENQQKILDSGGLNNYEKININVESPLMSIPGMKELVAKEVARLFYLSIQDGRNV